MNCIGFGEFEGKCTNKAGTKWSPYWCERCNALRLDHIEESLRRIHAEAIQQARSKAPEFVPHLQAMPKFAAKPPRKQARRG
jgi:hypothetical protein